ncbi:MAG TPA: LuxR C-terminal-related transcriptional regulator [Thermomicrobiales bacterium]|nr:LuxR C-terminal-related transcriptional regulator [Thermomicrobiales bacterium]
MLTLLPSKLHVPAAQPGRVARPHLIARLDAGLRGKLTLLAAPAGFGKTTLAAAWIAQAGRPFGWLALDADDNDPLTFFRYLAAAIEPLGGCGRSLRALAGGEPQPLRAGALARALLADLSSAGACGLVLDDYHAITSEDVHAAVSLVLEHLPPAVHLVLTSRVDPPLPLPRLRARGELAELRAADLRFSEAELAQVVEAATAAPLSPRSLRLLATRTEGWIAGIHLAALSMRRMTRADEVARFVEDFAGSHRYVFDYLMEEVLAHQSASSRDFLLRTSILERFCAPLCAAVLGATPEARDAIAQAQAQLVALERANLFIVPLDDERRWYRYHHLFADLLRRRLLEDAPAAVAELYERACRWHEREGDAATAFDYALRGGHTGHAARVLDATALALVDNSEVVRFLRLVAHIPAAVRAAQVRLSLAHAWALTFDARAEAAEPAVAAAEAHLAHPERLPADLPAPLLVATIAALRAYIATRTGSPEAALRHSSAALAALDAAEGTLAGTGVVDYTRGLVLLNLGIIHQRLTDDPRAAERAYLAALPLNHAANRPFPIIAAYGNFMELCRARGQFDRAVALGREGLAWIERQAGALFPAEQELHRPLIEIAYERDELAAAAAHEHRVGELEALIDRPPGSRLGDDAARAYLSRFLVAHARGEHAAALGHLGELQWALLRQELRTPSLGAAIVARIQLHLWRARPGDARLLADLRRWATECGLDAGDPFTHPAEPGYAALAPVLLALGERDAALALAGRLCRVAERAGRFGDLLGYQVTHALALDALGQRDAAIAAIGRALELGEPVGAMRSFLDAGAPARALLRAAPATPYRDTILRALGDALAPAPAAAETPLIEPLSAREREVLRLLASGRTNQEIAGELSVAVTTAKKHISNIIGKLGVRNRTEAIARARALHLL